MCTWEIPIALRDLALGQLVEGPQPDDGGLAARQPGHRLVQGFMVLDMFEGRVHEAEPRVSAAGLTAAWRGSVQTVRFVEAIPAWPPTG
jgi:hypothetical protein